jgi:hypothetical protein
MGLRGSRKLTPALFNRRMRKTACPVVWKGHGVQIPVTPSNQYKFNRSTQTNVFLSQVSRSKRRRF